MNVSIWGGLPVTCLPSLGHYGWSCGLCGSMKIGLRLYNISTRPPYSLFLYVYVELLLVNLKHHLQLRLDDLHPSCCRWCRENKVSSFFCIIKSVIEKIYHILEITIKNFERSLGSCS